MPQVHIRRAYSDGRHGQLHLTTGYPSGGGFDERSPLLCIHPASSNGRWYQHVLPEFGKDRSVYAPDLPGYGQSDPIGIELGLTDHIAGLGDFLDSMRLRTIDVMGTQLGAEVAVALATQRPQQIRRVILVGSGQAATVQQPTLVIQPADAGKRVERDAAHYTVKEMGQTLEQLFGASAPEFLRTVRAFLDRQ